MTTIKNTIVYFHIGRGGRYHNSGHVTFYGQKNIKEVLRMLDSGKHWNFIAKENESKIYRMLKKRGLKNLLALFEKCRDNDDFEIFEKKTGLKLGEDIYTDGNGDELITVAQVETGCGTLDWDGDY